MLSVNCTLCTKAMCQWIPWACLRLYWNKQWGNFFLSSAFVRVLAGTCDLEPWQQLKYNSLNLLFRMSWRLAGWNVNFHFLALHFGSSAKVSRVIIAHYCFTVFFFPPYSHCNSSFIYVTVVIYCIVLFVGGRNEQFYATFSFPASLSAALILFLHLHWHWGLRSVDHWILTPTVRRQLIRFHDHFNMRECARTIKNKIKQKKKQQGPLIGSRQEW